MICRANQLTDFYEGNTFNGLIQNQRIVFLRAIWKWQLQNCREIPCRVHILDKPQVIVWTKKVFSSPSVYVVGAFWIKKVTGGKLPHQFNEPFIYNNGLKFFRIYYQAVFFEPFHSFAAFSLWFKIYLDTVSANTDRK